MPGVGGRGLALGPRNAKDLHAPRRVAIDPPCQRRQSIPRVRHDRGRDPGDVALGDDEGGPATDGFGRELRPVTLEAGDGYEGEARLDAPGIMRHTPNTPHLERNLRPENPSKLCPVQDHRPSVASAKMRTLPEFSRENATPRNMPEIPLKQHRNTRRFLQSKNVVKESTVNRAKIR